MKIIFISNNLASTHDKNRIEEFIGQGADVAVYGFSRTADSGRVRDSDLYKPTVVGNIEPRYSSRIRTYWNAIKKITSIHKNENCIYYLFGFDLAMVFYFQKKNLRYIYEEADLVYTYIGSKLVISILKMIDKRVIEGSFKTVMTSQGFIRYHFSDRVPDNVILVTNRLNQSVLGCRGKVKQIFDKNKIKIGFVGAPRFKSIYNFIEVFCTNFPKYEFHVYGGPIPNDFEPLKKFTNCYFHGRFTSPIDLPDIYSDIDIVLCTYHVTSDNVKYAEPNKIYESIYFETPILVSKGTFLESKVTDLGIGYSIDAMNNNEIIDFVNTLDKETINKCIYNIRKIDKSYCIDRNTEFIQSLLLLQ